MRISDWSSDVCSSDLLNVFDRDRIAILEAQQIFEQHLHGKGQARNIAQLRRSFFQGVIANRLPSHIHRLAGAERVLSYSSHEANLSKRQGKMAFRPVLVCSDADRNSVV